MQKLATKIINNNKITRFFVSQYCDCTIAVNIEHIEAYPMQACDHVAAKHSCDLFFIAHNKSWDK